MAIVYMATNNINGKRYIGVTKQTLKKRRRQHLGDAKSGRLTSRVFHRAINKYGSHVFSWSILSTKETKDEASLEEIRLIAEINPEYNLTKGGDGISGAKKPLESLESISKPVTCLTDVKNYISGSAACRHYGISVGRLSVICNNGGSTKGLMFKFTSDDIAPIKQQKSQEEIAQYKAAVEAGREKAIDKVRIPIVCQDTGKKYRSVIDATVDLGITPSTLYSALRRGNKCKGMTFVFEK